MQAIDITRHSRITKQLVPSTTALSFVCCSQFACKKSCSWLSVRPSYKTACLIAVFHYNRFSIAYFLHHTYVGHCPLLNYEHFSDNFGHWSIILCINKDTLLCVFEVVHKFCLISTIFTFPWMTFQLYSTDSQGALRKMNKMFTIYYLGVGY